MHEIISCTTRPPREGEINGINYHFLTNQEFADKIESGEMKPHIYKTLPFEMANEAQGILERGENIGKVVLTLTH